MTGAVRVVFFDLYGTLLDLAPLNLACERVVPGRGEAFARAWRAEQLRLTWLRTIVGAWADFQSVTSDALASTARSMGAEPHDAFSTVADAFDRLPARREVRTALDELRRAGLPLGVLSNGSAGMLDRSLANAGLADSFAHVLSADTVQRYKPHPAVYALAAAATGHPPSSIGFATTNDWDAAGGCAFGFAVAWLRPSGLDEAPRLGAPGPTITTWTDLPRLFIS